MTLSWLQMELMIDTESYARSLDGSYGIGIQKFSLKEWRMENVLHFFWDVGMIGFYNVAGCQCMRMIFENDWRCSAELSWVGEWLLGAECWWQRRRCRTRGRYRIRELSVEVFPWVCNSMWLQIQFRSHTWHIIPCTSLCCYLPLRQHHLIAVSHEGTFYPLTSIAWVLGCCRVLSVCVEAEWTAINTER